MANKRSWYTGLLLIPRIALRTVGAFRAQGLGRFVPVVLVLLVGSAMLWALSSVAPLAPFIYSLF
jgi:hypothetical protein